jgi:hypothetical protein
LAISFELTFILFISFQGINSEVRKKILALIQTWGRLFISKRGLGYVSDTYQILKNEGYDFPPADNVGAAIVETEAVSYSTYHYLKRSHCVY